MFRFDSIRFKISVLYVAVLGLILATYSATIYGSVRYTLYSNLDHELRVKATELGNLINEYLAYTGQGRGAVVLASRRVLRLENQNIDGVLQEMEQRLLKTMEEHHLKKDLLSLRDSQGQSLVNSWDPAYESTREFSPELRATPHAGVEYRNFKTPKGNFRLIRLPVQLRNGQNYIIQVATSRAYVDKLLRQWLIFMAVTIPVFMFLASFVGRLFSDRIVTPVMSITRTAERITHENLSERVRAEGADEEIQYLINAFNGMIGNLERSFKHIAEFSTHVAHELKTPLAVIRGESEVALRKERTAEEYRRVLEVNLKETQQMIRVIEDLLLLARMNYESDIFQFDNMDLKAFLSEIADQGRILAEPRQITVGLELPETPVTIRGDALHLRRLFLNLVDNAIKYSPSGSTVGLALKVEDRGVKIDVRDQGDGIPEADRNRIFEQFFRVESSRKKQPGVGLGLTIALAIARAHQGNIQVSSSPGQGSVFTVTFPLL